MLDDLSEEDVIKNLNQHLGYPSGIRVNTGADLTSITSSHAPLESNYLRGAVPPPSIVNQPYSKQDADILSKLLENPQYVSYKNSDSEYKNDLFCRNCGGKYTSVDNFCGACGFKRA
jgi:hypothetical protein